MLLQSYLLLVECLKRTIEIKWYNFFPSWMHLNDVKYIIYCSQALLMMIHSGFGYFKTAKLFLNPFIKNVSHLTAKKI